MTDALRPWAYYLEFDGSERSDAEAAAERGDALGLVRAPVGADFAAERLVPGTGWRRTTVLTQERLRGGDLWFYPIGHDRVRELLTRWTSAGHLHAGVEFEPTVPPELERTLAGIDERHAARDTLTAVADEGRLEAIRARVLAGPGDFAHGWLVETGNAVVATAPDLLLGDLVDAERVAAAFRAVGAERLLALTGDPRTAELAGPPSGLELDATAAAVRAADDRGLLGPRLLVDEETRAAVLDAEEYVLLAGPAEFLTAVLDRTVPEARVAFADQHPELDTVRRRYARFGGSGSPSWQYLLVGPTDDRDLALSRALAADGSSVLVRAVDATDVEESARRDGSWGDTDRLARIRYRGDIAWAVPIGADEARLVVSAWHAAGRFDTEPPVDETVPDDLAARLDADAIRRDHAGRLRGGPELDAGAIARVRAHLLDGPADLDAGWAAVPGRVVVPVQSALTLFRPDGVERIRRAFGLVGATSLWAVSTADAGTTARWQVPTGVTLPNEGDWLAGLGSVYFAAGELLITTPALDAAILQADEYGLVGGSTEFVEAVLGRGVDAARDAFRAYLRGESYRAPRRDLSGVVDRYPLRAGK